jgi:hypothetical protein
MEPRVEVEMTGASKSGGVDRWRTAWRIKNLGKEPLQILATRLPHGKFRSEEKTFEPSLDVPANESISLEIEARCGEPPGAEVENGFVILRVAQEDALWLILVRVKVRIAADGTPSAATELITVQPVGFSKQQTI